MRKLFVGAMTLMFCVSSAGLSFAYEKEIKALSVTMCEKVTKAGKKNLAVADFTDLQGNTTELGRFLAEELSAELADNAKGFEMVDRNNLRSILTEHKFSMSGLVDPKTVKELGRIAGVDAIVTGTITPFGDSVRVSAKVIATDTAKVIATAKGDIAKTKAIEELLCKGIDTRAEASPVAASSTPVPKSAKGKQNVEAQNLLFESQGCRLSVQSVTCTLLVTNKSKDKSILIYGNRGSASSRIIDNAGNEFRATRVKLGTREEEGYVENTQVENVPSKLILTFGNIDSQPENISLLDISIQADYKNFQAQIRNIPLSK